MRRDAGGATSEAPGVTSSTGSTNRKPWPGSVRTISGPEPSSPIALRTSRIARDSDDGPTTTSGHTASKSSSRVTARSRCRRRKPSTSSTLGWIATAAPLRTSSRRLSSRTTSPKRNTVGAMRDDEGTKDAPASSSRRGGGITSS